MSSAVVVVVPEIVPRLPDEDGCSTGSQARRGSVLRPVTGDPIPVRPVRASGCALGADVTAWLSRRPHVPLARVGAHGIERAGRACCAAFAARGSRWREVDRWGQVVGEVSVTGGAGYDVTSCYELCVSEPRSPAGVGLFASTGGPWQPPPPAGVVPDAAQWASALALDSRVRSLAPDVPDPPPLEARALFFRAEGAVHLVLGGRALVIARWQDRHGWLPLLTRIDSSGLPPTLTPLAVFDLDGDAVPEVVVELDAGDGWDDSIFRLEDGRWQEVATSVGGSTA